MRISDWSSDVCSSDLKFYLTINAKLPPRKQKLLFSIPLLSRVIKRKILSELGLDQTRVAMTGAAPLAPHIIAWYRQLGLELLEVFGMTENCATRSEERRVGKGGVSTCRARGSPYH